MSEQDSKPGYVGNSSRMGRKSIASKRFNYDRVGNPIKKQEKEDNK